MPDDAAVVLTHADLHPSNIMVSTESPFKVVTLIDWHQSAWYPDYWEFSKAVFTSDSDGEWREKCIPMFVDDPGRVADAWDDYARALRH